MPSKRKKAEQAAFVWVWLPGRTEPVVAGKLTAEGRILVFNYGRSYLERKNAISLYDPELPLRAGALPLFPGLAMPSCLRDAAPDAWGRRVLLNRLLGERGAAVDTTRLDELTYLLESGSNRTGALDFQRSATEYVPRDLSEATLAGLMRSAEQVEKGIPLTGELAEALQHGTAIGGARPKALIRGSGVQYVAKFSSSTDLYSVVKAEFVAMTLARHVGLDVAPVQLKRVANRDVLLVERFDRVVAEAGWERRALVSALTLLELDELMARYASYEDLAEIVRHRFEEPRESLRKLYARLTFNILCGNTDDHARNHAAFWDGQLLRLTPAFDVCPQSRTGNEASQAMLIAGEDRRSRITSCVAAAHHFQLTEAEALKISRHQVDTIGAHWSEVAAEARLNRTDRKLLATRQFLNPYALEDSGIERPDLV
jgi:serine/threonine-protein kinase HipA